MKGKVIGTLAICAAWIFSLSDHFINIKDMFGPGFHDAFQGMPEHIAIFGAFSFLAFPFLAMGLAHIFRRAQMNAFIPWMKGFLATVPVFIHTSFLYYYFTIRELGDGRAPLLQHFDFFKNIMGAAYFLGLLVLCACLFVYVLRGKSTYPTWFAWSIRFSL